MREQEKRQKSNEKRMKRQLKKENKAAGTTQYSSSADG